MQLSSRILTALAVLILAVAVVAVRAGSPGTVEAATGTIDVLNVGTCYTTNTDLFAVGDCDDGDGNVEDEPTEGYNVAGRDAITKVDSVFATYAIDPKTSGNVPRAILMNSDVIKISIEDKKRDKRTGVLYAVQPITIDLGVTNGPLVAGLLGDLANDLRTYDADTDGTGADSTPHTLGLTLPITANFVRNDGSAARGVAGTIVSSGDAEFRLQGGGSTMHPMAPDGEIRWLGTTTATGEDPSPLRDLSGEYITLDEDLSSGTQGEVAPWMRVSATIPDGLDITVQYIYYQTSEHEDLIGGAADNSYTEDAEAPVFFDDEVYDADENTNPDALILRASADGDEPAQNLWLRETDRFGGQYEGYLRLTDTDGEGLCDHDDDKGTRTPEIRCNWGLMVKDAAGASKEDAEIAVIGVESGPVTITYKDSDGDVETITIQIDKDPPAIQIDSPLNKTSSKDDSPELLGSFSDGGGSGLREESFKIYADNRPDEQTDATAVWDLRVNIAGGEYGHVCVDIDEGNDNQSGLCDTDDPDLVGTTPVAVIRDNYAGFSPQNSTFGIIPSEDVYFAEDTSDPIDGQDEYKTGDAEDFDDGDLTGLFDTVVRIDFPPEEEDDRRYNHVIDIQAVVMDIAGNIGFSDSEPSDPAFIHDLGTEKNRDDDDKHNVIGWYSRHIYYLDDVDPKFEQDESATGFYVDGNGDEMTSGSGLMVVFDGPIDATTVGLGTFDVELDNGTEATVTGVVVDDDKVYVLLETELAPNATPKIELASGQSISDLAGNESTDRRLDGIELSDGILPTFTITLSGGTGQNEDTDGEGSTELTGDQMNIAITANEPIQGAPKFVVVCSDLTWGDNEDNDVAKFAANRKGDFTASEINAAEPSSKHAVKDPDGDPDDDSVPAAERTMCPSHVDAVTDDVATFFAVAINNANRRSGNNWEYDWSNLGDNDAVEDGKLEVVVWGRDRSSYMRGTDRVQNWSSASSNFVYDTVLKAAWDGDADGDEGALIPDDEDKVFEPRPFVLLDFGDEGTTVDVTSFKVDDVDYTAELQGLDDNEFVWWPEPLDYGTYEVYVEANDAANNQADHTYKFSVNERLPFVLDLLAGWNSISFPANPIDRALHAVFTNDAVDQVVGWNVTEPVSPWRIATRQDGVWTTSDEFATLNDVEARYGYWVHSTGFITQAVPLIGDGDRSSDGQPTPANIPTDVGWNFVGVVDTDGDQTQDDAGETLRNSNNDPITSAEYLGDYLRAYTWDHVNNTWNVLKKDEGIIIGTGVWVYYGSGIAP